MLTPHSAFFTYLTPRKGYSELEEKTKRKTLDSSSLSVSLHLFTAIAVDHSLDHHPLIIYHATTNSAKTPFLRLAGLCRSLAKIAIVEI